MSNLALNGKVALIQGGSRGIGAAIVKRLAAEGAAVAFTYVSSGAKSEELQNSITAAGGKALAIKACLLYTSPSPRDLSTSRMPSSA